MFLEAPLGCAYKEEVKVKVKVAGQATRSFPVLGLGIWAASQGGWGVPGGGSLPSDPQHAVCTQVIPSSSEMREPGGTVYTAWARRLGDSRFWTTPGRTARKASGLRPALGEA